MSSATPHKIWDQQRRSWNCKSPAGALSQRNMTENRNPYLMAHTNSKTLLIASTANHTWSSWSSSCRNRSPMHNPLNTHLSLPKSGMMADQNVIISQLTLWSFKTQSAPSCYPFESHIGYNDRKISQSSKLPMEICNTKTNLVRSLIADPPAGIHRWWLVETGSTHVVV